MTVSPNPRIFDISTATPVPALPGAGEPELQRVFWHGTRMSRLPAILEEGIVPGRSEIGHTCLASDPAIALLFARLQQSMMGGESAGDRPVLIRIDGARLDPDACAVETGAIEISAYGDKAQPERRSNALRALGQDWRAFHRATETLAYTAPIPVREDMLDTRVTDLPVLSVDALIEEMSIGAASDDATIAALARILADTRLARAA